MPQPASLQIPSQPPPPGPRPVSVAVHSQPPPQPSSSRRQQRASHTVTSPQQSTAGASPRDDVAPYTDVYSHPAAMAYASAHPSRTIPRFGPYLLLQTLGEGEFGKVKLGLHCQWGEEVAVKLIRRGNIDNAVRMSKVEREIEVLRTLKHPNIVRLYDVIETDKYIGIILEYASGGELFDHILAHRYLRERDAAKLFSQLVSGVWYIHEKKIVHRDLKLENLLLDRHRNVIITDFGFANRFEHRSDDLMQTSCGSPCYAAPELVISEGLYVGSAVDIWSCGVILYAMLAGYLPFDDDPANPDGDNINLLYRYIVNTPLSFPDYISAEARDLLGMMLVPDPTRRSTLEDIMKHPWLAVYATPKGGVVSPGGVPTAFGRSVDQLERAAMEQHQQKRLAYQKQMRAAALAAAQQPAVTTPVGRSQSHYAHTGSGHRATATEPTGRSQSTQPEYLYDSAVDLSVSMSSPTPAQPSSSRGIYGNSKVEADDDPFGLPQPPSTAKTQMLTTDVGQSSKTHKSGGSGGEFRHTIQVEYDEPKNQRPKKSEDKDDKTTGRTSTQRQSPSRVQTQNRHQSPNRVASPSTRERRPSQGSIHATMKPLPLAPLITADTPAPLPPPHHSPPSLIQQTPITTKPTGSPSNKVPTAASPNTTPTKNRGNNRSRTSSVNGTPTISIDAASPPGTPIKFAAAASSPSLSTDEALERQQSKGHRRGQSSLDKLRLAKIFGSTSTSTQGQVQSGPISTVNGRTPSEVSATGKSTSSVHLSPGEQKSTNGSSDKVSEKVEDKGKKEEGGKKTRRNTLTVMVEPISRTLRNRSAKNKAPGASGEPASPLSTASKDKRQQRTVTPPLAAILGDNAPAKSSAGNLTSFSSANGDFGDASAGIGMQASTTKARKVMQWFRSKGKVQEGGGDEEGEKEKGNRQRSKTPTQTEYKKGHAVSSTQLGSSLNSSTNGKSAPPVQVVVTSPTSGANRIPSTSSGSSTQAHRTPSTATADSSVPPSLVTRFRNSVTIGNSNHSLPVTKGAAVAAHPWGALRTHHGAVDQSTITMKPPPEVIKHVKEVLEGMGMEIYVEAEYKFRCIRAKKRKGSMVLGSVGPSAGGVSTAGGAPGIAAITMVGSAASNGVDKRGLPLPSPSSFSVHGGMLRGLLMRRQSSRTSGNGVVESSLGAYDDVPLSAEPSSLQETMYGDANQDAGDEVKFSVELTRIDRLNDTFSLDIRRLKGNLRSYKFLYDTIRERAHLQR